MPPRFRTSAIVPQLGCLTLKRWWSGIGEDYVLPTPLQDFSGHHVTDGDGEHRREDGRWKRSQTEPFGNREIRKRHRHRCCCQRRPQERATRTTPVTRSRGTQNEHHCEFGEGRLHEPTGPQQFGRRVETNSQHQERREIEEGADRSEDDHEGLNSVDVPPHGPLDLFRIHAIGRDRHTGNVGEEIEKQDLKRN